MNKQEMVGQAVIGSKRGQTCLITGYYPDSAMGHDERPCPNGFFTIIIPSVGDDCTDGTPGMPSSWATWVSAEELIAGYLLVGGDEITF